MQQFIPQQNIPAYNQQYQGSSIQDPYQQQMQFQQNCQPIYQNDLVNQQQQMQQPIQQQPLQYLNQQTQQQSNIFGIMIPGQLPISQFEYINSMYCIDLPQPATVNNLSFFLFSPLPEGFAAALYYSVPPYESLQLLGAVANSRPSEILHTGFALKPEVNEISSLKLVIKIVELQQLKSMFELLELNDAQKNYAKLVAQNLYNFLLSFHKEGQVKGNYLVVPSNIFDQWLMKFEQKYKMDPNFIYKTTKQ